MIDLAECTTKPLRELKSGDLALVWHPAGVIVAIALETSTEPRSTRPFLALHRPAKPLSRPLFLEVPLGTSVAVSVGARVTFEVDLVSPSVSLIEREVNLREGSMVLFEDRLIFVGSKDETLIFVDVHSGVFSDRPYRNSSAEFRSWRAIIQSKVPGGANTVLVDHKDS